MLGLGFILLLLTFRSIVIPLTAIILTLLSGGAVYGVLVLVFQQGRLQSLLGSLHRRRHLVATAVPIAVLFGLSMHYHVLILSRVGESYDNGMNTEQAISHGNRATGLVPEDRSAPCESFSRPGLWARKELHDEATQAHAGADYPQVAGG